MNVKTIIDLLKQTYNEWNEDKAPRLGAALAYYTVFSIAPLLVVAVAIAGMVFGRDAAQGQIYGQIRDVVGPKTAGFIQDLIKNANHPASNRRRCQA